MLSMYLFKVNVKNTLKNIIMIQTIGIHICAWFFIFYVKYIILKFQLWLHPDSNIMVSRIYGREVKQLDKLASYINTETFPTKLLRIKI